MNLFLPFARLRIRALDVTRSSSASKMQPV